MKKLEEIVAEVGNKSDLGLSSFGQCMGVARQVRDEAAKLVATWHRCTDECSRPCKTKAIFAALVRQLRSEGAR